MPRPAYGRLNYDDATYSEGYADVREREVSMAVIRASHGCNTPADSTIGKLTGSCSHSV